VLWTTGYPDQALERATEALAMAERMAHPFTRAFALLFISALQQFRRDHASCHHHATALVALATEHGFTFLRALGRVVTGGAMVEIGDPEQGLAVIEQGWAECQTTGAEVGGTYFRSLLSQANTKVGRLAKALEVLDEALLAAPANGEHWWEPELLRLRGELLLLTEREHPSLRPALLEGQLASPRAHFLEAIRLARQQGAKMLELRAARSLVQLGGDRREREAAHSGLQGISDWFAEGLGCVDLVEARSLLRRT
jgi:predicted ATPase